MARRLGPRRKSRRRWCGRRLIETAGYSRAHAGCLFFVLILTNALSRSYAQLYELLEFGLMSGSGMSTKGALHCAQ